MQNRNINDNTCAHDEYDRDNKKKNERENGQKKKLRNYHIVKKLHFC